MASRLWNVLLVLAVLWLILMWNVIGGMPYLGSVLLVGGTPLILLLIGRYVVAGGKH